MRVVAVDPVVIRPPHAGSLPATLKVMPILNPFRSFLVVLLCVFAWGLVAASTTEAATIVFLIGEREYETRETLPTWAADHLEPLGHRCIFVHALQERPNVFPGAALIDEADLLVVSVRRRALAKDDLDRVRRHLAAGKPLIALRTACHAFDPKGELPEGSDAWRTFDVDVLGARYDNHLKNGPKSDDPNAADTATIVDPLRREAAHAVMAGIPPQPFPSGGTLYRMFDLRADADLLVNGRATVEGQTYTFPVVWVRTTSDGSRILATTLGHRTDFEQPAFRRLLTNGAAWCLGEATGPVALRPVRLD